MADGEVLYRVEAARYSNGADEYGDPLPGSYIDVHVREFSVLRRTPKGWRLRCGRVVLRTTTKKFACPTIEEAYESFYARKQRHASILQKQLEQVQEAVRLAKLKQRGLSRYAILPEPANG